MSIMLKPRATRVVDRPERTERITSDPRKYKLPLVLVIASAAMGFVTDERWLLVLSGFGVAVIAALGLQVLTGFTGQISLGHAAFLGVGYYTTVFLSKGTSDWVDGLLGNLPAPLSWVAGNDEGWPLLLGLLLAGGISALVGLAIGPAALRLRGLYLAIVTMGLVFLAGHVFMNWEQLTGGPQGTRYTLPAVGSHSFGDDSMIWSALTAERKQYLLILVVVLMSLFVVTNLRRTRLGRALQAVRDRDVAAEITGIPVSGYKLRAFAISSFMAGVAGALLGIVVPYAVPESWDLMLSIKFVAIIVIGGGGALGVVLGAAFVELLPTVILDLGIEVGGASPFQLQELVYGLAIILFLVLEPKGLRGIWDRIERYWKRWPFTY